MPSVSIRWVIAVLALVASAGVIGAMLSVADSQLERARAAEVAAIRMERSLAVDDIVESGVGEGGARRALAVEAIGFDLGPLGDTLGGDLAQSERSVDAAIRILEANPVEGDTGADELIDEVRRLRADVDADALDFEQLTDRYDALVQLARAVAFKERDVASIEIAQAGSARSIGDVARLEALGALKEELSDWLTVSVEISLGGGDPAETLGRTSTVTQRQTDLLRRWPALAGEPALVLVEDGATDRSALATLIAEGSRPDEAALIQLVAEQREALVALAELRYAENARVVERLEAARADARARATWYVLAATGVAIVALLVLLLILRFVDRRLDQVVQLADRIRRRQPVEDLETRRPELAELAAVRSTLRELDAGLRTDELTGLSNRAGLRRAFALGGSGGVLAIDLDGLKPVNDEHGHARGDLLLVELATRFIDEFRDTDVVARVGGDEFVVLVPSADDLQHVSDRVRDIASRPFDLADGVTVRISASVGRAIVRGGDLDSALLEADDALYAEKRRRRTGVTEPV